MFIKEQVELLLMRAKLILEELRSYPKEEQVIMEGVVNELYQLTLRFEQKVTEEGIHREASKAN